MNYREGEAEVVPTDELQHKSDRYYYREALNFDAGEVFVSEFDLNIEHGQIQRPLNPVLRFLTPVVDSSGAKQGLLAVNYSGDHLLRRFSEVSLPGSTLLINSQGEYIYGLHAGDAWGWLCWHTTGPSRSIFLRHGNRIGSRSEGQFSTAEGLFTFRLASLSQSSAASTTAPSSQDTVHGGSDPAPLLIVAYVPPDLLYAASTKLLKQLMLMYTGAMVLLSTIGWYWAHSAAVRTMQARSIAESEARLRTLSNQLLTAQEVERRSICRELHDELGQLVTAIHLDLQSATQQEDTARTQSLLHHAIEETDQLLKSLHEIASRVRPSVLDDLGLQEAVETVASEIHRRAGVSVETQLDFDEAIVSPQIGENTYRIVQEALMNVAKHAETKQASVEIGVNSNDLRITVADHGAGFDPRQLDGSRLGILGMRERAELLGGHFALFSKPGEGTRVDIRIPLGNGRT